MTRDDHYPVGTVRAVLDTDLVTSPTAAALKQRLGPVNAHVGLLDERGLALLDAVCGQLIPQNDRAAPIDIAGRLHSRVATGGGDGWRYAVLPADGIALRDGVTGIDESALVLTGHGFVELSDDQRDTVLAAVQSGVAPGGTWARIDPKRWFEELLVAITAIYYSHPLAQEEIGYLGMADAHGWGEVGLGARAPFEPVAGRSE